MTYILRTLLAAAMFGPFAFAHPGKQFVSKGRASFKSDKSTNAEDANLPVAVRPIIWKFANGSRLMINPNSGVEFGDREQNYSREILAGNIVQYPQRTEDVEPNSNSAYPSSPQRIAFLQAGRQPWIVTQGGNLVKVPLNLDNVLPGKNVLRFSLVPVDALENGKTVHYYVLSIAYAPLADNAELEKRQEVVGTLNFGETFILREDGDMQRLDYRFHDRNFGNALQVSEVGLLRSTGSEYHRSFDLLRWEAEKEFVARPIGPVKAPGGNYVDPSDVMSGFAQNLTQEIRNDVLERHLNYETLDPEIRDTFRRTLAKKEMNSMVLLGPAGTGKTEVVKMFIAEVNKGLIPDIPRSTQFISIDSTSLNSGTMYRGSEMSRVEAIIAQSQLAPVILIMDEIHSLKGSGTSNKNENDIWETLKPHLATGRIKVIGMSTKEEFNAAYSGNRPLYERFYQFHLQVPTKNEAMKKADSWTRKHGLPALSPETLEHAYYLSEEFNAIGAQPRKMILLLIDAYADMKINGKAQVAPRIDDLDTAAKRVYNLDPAYFSQDGARAKLASLRLKLGATIVGQEEAKDVLIRQATISLGNAHDLERPRLTAAFAGPKGTGKTDLAIAFGDAMGVPNKRLMLGQYDDPISLLREIKEALQANAFTNFVLDEADKANKKVLEALLPILDKGRFILPAHKNNAEWIDAADVSARNASFIFTGNFGSSLAKKEFKVGFTESQPEEVKKGSRDRDIRAAILADGFSEYILDRVSAVAHMDYLDQNQFRGVLALHLERILVDQTRRQRIPVDSETKDVLVDSLTQEYWEPQMSNRDALRLLNEELRFKIAEAILGQPSKPQALDLKFNADTKTVEACEDLVASQKGA
jgi:ATP-dependent Clp protease ATP-binding subunit ClpA